MAHVFLYFERSVYIIFYISYIPHTYEGTHAQHARRIRERFRFSSNQNHAYLSYPPVTLHANYRRRSASRPGSSLFRPIVCLHPLFPDKCRPDVVHVRRACRPVLSHPTNFFTHLPSKTIYARRPQDGRAAKRRRDNGGIKESSKKNVRKRLRRQSLHLESSHLKLTPTSGMNGYYTGYVEYPAYCVVLCPYKFFG